MNADRPTFECLLTNKMKVVVVLMEMRWSAAEESGKENRATYNSLSFTCIQTLGGFTRNLTAVRRLG